MLAANERLTGRTFVYDGNPHEFGDPAHAARVSAPATAMPPPQSTGTNPNRNEDLVAHVKQRGGAGAGAERRNGGSNRKSGKGGNGRQAGAAAASSAPATGDFPSTGRSQSRGKAGDGAKPRPSASANANGARGGVEAPNNGPAAASIATAINGASSLGATAGFHAPAARNACSQAVGSLCTEGVGEDGGGAPAIALWGGAPAAGSSSAGGAGANVFGDFKFDMLDIMSAVPQG